MLLIGFAPWPMSWYAHLPRQYARTALDVCRYLEVALVTERATAWWPAVIALEQVMDAITATVLAVSGGAEVPRSGVRQLCDTLRAVGDGGDGFGAGGAAGNWARRR